MRAQGSVAAAILTFALTACMDDPAREPFAPTPEIAPTPEVAPTPEITTASGFGTDLVGWWRFDRTSASPLVTDESGLSNHGELEGDAQYTSNALLGSAVDVFDASGHVTIPHDASLEPEEGTIEVWLKVPALKDTDVLAKTTLCMVRSDPGCTMLIGRSVIGLRIEGDGGVSALIGNDDPNAPGPWTFATVAANAITTNTWHHLAMRWNGSELTLFIDGLPQAVTPYDPVPGTGLSYSNGSSLWLGAATSWGQGHPGDREFIGVIDDVRYYARARHNVEIFIDYVTKGYMPAKL